MHAYLRKSSLQLLFHVFATPLGRCPSTRSSDQAKLNSRISGDLEITDAITGFAKSTRTHNVPPSGGGRVEITFRALFSPRSPPQLSSVLSSVSTAISSLQTRPLLPSSTPNRAAFPCRLRSSTRSQPSSSTVEAENPRLELLRPR